MTENPQKMIVIYVTCAGEQAAHKIADHVVGLRLAACANIFAPHQSVYHWKGKVERTQETALIFKTRADLFESCRAAICAVHDYECPCIVSWDMDALHGPYRDWILAETQTRP